MSGWAAKRFWQAAHVVETEGGYSVRLDTRDLKTPAKAPLVVPTRAMAEAIAAEWDAQPGKVRPETMPVTRSANSAIDKVTPQFDEVVALVAAYGETDLLCYRATTPQALIERQAAAWDPLLAWAEEALDAPLVVTSGVMHVDQPEQSVARLRGLVAAMTPFQLTAFHELVAISGSLVLGLAVVRGQISEDEAWNASRVDEKWQAEVWGEDEEAAASESQRHEGYAQAARFFALCG